ncbi:hypothetical protein TNIN_23831 [Trichonephila inaurata madagascariensis]|uniref:Uncharacterized protein n=1 Tax=Trichonephila inaurata madagascariensis TaxID=2747483 RepID=A0A8X6YCY7_9ARAC|nr:hypothetical protein TNIN_23831 [Trichonephila inaurata madagascariensis]
MSRGWPEIRYSDLFGKLCAILLTHLTLQHQIITWTIILVANPSPMKQKCSHGLFGAPPPEFYRKGIEQLETRSQKVLDADGDYLED